MKLLALIGLFTVLTGSINAESFRASIVGQLDLASSFPEGSSLSLGYIDSVIINLDNDLRFLRGIELDLRLPSGYLAHRGSLALAVYSQLNPPPSLGIIDLQAERLLFELMPAKLQVVYQIPLHQDHGLKASPYVSVPPIQLDHTAFPLLLRIMPIMKGLPDEIEKLQFQLSLKPLLSDEGALSLVLDYPATNPDGEISIRIDGHISDFGEAELLLKEGEHLLTVHSDAYRFESRRFFINRAKTTQLIIELEDVTPEVIIEAPVNALITIDGQELSERPAVLRLTEGIHVFRISIDDYIVSRTVNLIRGRKYRVALSLDLTVTESD